MLVLWDLLLPSPSLQPQDPPASKEVLETTLDLCRECRKLCGWLRQRARLIWVSTGWHVMLLPNFGEVSGGSDQLPLTESSGSRRFAVASLGKEHLPHHHRGRLHGFRQHREPRKVAPQGATAPRVTEGGSSPEGYTCQTLFKSFIFQNIHFIYNCSVYSFTYNFIPNL